MDPIQISDATFGALLRAKHYRPPDRTQHFRQRDRRRSSLPPPALTVPRPPAEARVDWSLEYVPWRDEAHGVWSEA